MLTTLAGASSVVLAHGGVETSTQQGFAAGLLHPLTGADHLAAMLAVGMWSALAMRPVWLAPLAFVVMLAAGATAGFAGLQLPAVEPMVAASLLVIGLLVAVRQTLSMASAGAIVGLFALFHGAAHGGELGGQEQWPALVGVLLSTAALHFGGVLVGRLVLLRHRWLPRAAGAAVALLGCALLFQMT